MRKKILKIFALMFLSLFLLALCFLLLFKYSNIGIFKSMREVYIETAMTTFKHHYLAEWFFSQEEIDGVMRKYLANTSKDIQNEDLESVKTEEAKDNTVEIFDISGVGYSGKMLVIHNPERVRLEVSDKLFKEGEVLGSMVKRLNATGGVNAGGFMDAGGHGNGGIPVGIVIKDGVALKKPKQKYYELVGFNYDNKLIVGKYPADELDKLNLRDAVDFGPPLIVDGKKQIDYSSGVHPRTSIGQTKDGKVLMLVVDGRQVDSVGITLKQAQDIMYEYGAYNASNLDGGASTSMWYGGELQNNPCGKAGERRIPTAFIIEAPQ